MFATVSCAENIPDVPGIVRARDRNLLVQVAYDAQRTTLRATLDRCGWSLRATARALGFVTSKQQLRTSDLLREIDKLDLRAEYNDALAARRAK